MRHPVSLLRETALIVFLSIALGTPAKAESRVTIIAASEVLADIARQVGGRYVDVQTATEENADLGKIAQADFVVMNGLEYDDWIVKQAEVAKSKAGFIVASRGIKPKISTDGVTNPYAWMAPAHGKRYAANIAEVLEDHARERAKPEQAQEFRINASQYIAEIEETDQTLHALFEDIPDGKRVIVTGQDSFAYFAAAYDLIALPCSAPDAADAIKTYGIKRLLLDAASEPRPTMLLAAETGTRLGGKLYVQPTPQDGTAPNYLAVLKHSAAAIAKAMRENGP